MIGQEKHKFQIFENLNKYKVKKINIFWKGANASKSSYKIEEIQETFSEDFDFFQNEKNKI